MICIIKSFLRTKANRLEHNMYLTCKSYELKYLSADHFMRSNDKCELINRAAKLVVMRDSEI